MSIETDNVIRFPEEETRPTLEGYEVTEILDEAEVERIRTDNDVNEKYMEDIYSTTDAKGIKSLTGAAIIANAMSRIKGN